MVRFELPRSASELDEYFAEAQKFAEVGAAFEGPTIGSANLISAFLLSVFTSDPDLQRKPLEFVQLAQEFGVIFNVAKAALWRELQKTRGDASQASFDEAKNELGGKADGDSLLGSPAISTENTQTN